MVADGLFADQLGVQVGIVIGQYEGFSGVHASFGGLNVAVELMLRLRIARLRAQPCGQRKAEEKFCQRHINTSLSDLLCPREPPIS